MIKYLDTFSLFGQYEWWLVPNVLTVVEFTVDASLTYIILY